MNQVGHIAERRGRSTRTGGAREPGSTPAIFCAALLVAACSGSPSSTQSAEAGEELSGGETTVFDVSRDAFTLPARNLKGDRRQDFFAGNSIFNRVWITAPSSTVEFDGLGPTFNATSCSACHFKDGRGEPPVQEEEPFLGLLVRLSIPGVDGSGAPLPEPSYGGQFNHRSILGVPAEGKAIVSYREVPGSYADGSSYSLRTPEYTFRDLAYGPLSPEIQLSPRVAPFMIGLGLLEAVPEAALLALADPDDQDGDGISGRVNYVWDVRAQSNRIGRFGWKANQPSLVQQTAAALLGDMGITSPMFPDENCPAVQTGCREAKTGGEPEIAQAKVDAMAYYSQFLAVPARRDVSGPEVLSGKALFSRLGCARCHVSKLQTGTAEHLELCGQTIRPYTDLLLHDMGAALADERPDFQANGREWRTPPLWGIGLVRTVNRHTYFMHDGRARSLEEAILWHGGEAENAGEQFRQATAAERRAVLVFLESL